MDTTVSKFQVLAGACPSAGEGLWTVHHGLGTRNVHVDGHDPEHGRVHVPYRVLDRDTVEVGIVPVLLDVDGTEMVAGGYVPETWTIMVFA